VQAVRRWPVEAQRGGSLVAIDWEAGASECRTTQRRLIHPFPRVGEARIIAAQHLVIGHQMMTESHGLRDLQVSVARHDCLDLLFRASDEHPLQTANSLQRFIASAPDPPAKV